MSTTSRLRDLDSEFAGAEDDSDEDYVQEEDQESKETADEEQEEEKPPPRKKRALPRLIWVSEGARANALNLFNSGGSRGFGKDNTASSFCW